MAPPDVVVVEGARKHVRSARLDRLNQHFDAPREDDTTASRTQKLEERLAVAGARRERLLEERRARAKTASDRSLAAAQRLSERAAERAARLEAKLARLQQAEQARQALRTAAPARRSGDGAAGPKPAATAESLAARLGCASPPAVLATPLPEQAPAAALRQAGSAAAQVQCAWRRFAASGRTTAQLAAAFQATGVPAAAEAAAAQEGRARPQPAPAPAPSASASAPAAVPPLTFVGALPAGDRHGQDAFEGFAATLRAPATLQAAAALLRRLAARLPPGGRAAGVGPVLRRLFPRARRPERYPARVFLCAFMLLAHPQVVFSRSGETEAALSRAAAGMTAAFRALLAGLTRAPAAGEGSGGLSGAALLAAFDAAWLPYLQCFAAWKAADAASLEGELVRVACELEASLLAKLAGATSPRHSPQDREALVQQVAHDHGLLRERVQRLGGAAGVARLEAGLAAARAAAAAAQPPATPPQSPGREARRAPASPATPPPPQSLRAAAPAPATGSPGAGRVTNESLAWELLYDRSFQLPAGEAEAAWADATGAADVRREAAATPADARAVARRVARLAEAAFWDRLADATPEHLAALLAELGGQLAEALPPGSRLAAEARRQLRAEGLLEAVAAGSAQGLLPALQQLAALLRAAGSPARQEAALAAHGAVQQQLAAAGGNAAAVRAALARALRLLAAQLRLLQLDMGNASLRLLAGSLGGGEGLSYARQKFAERRALPAEPGAGELAAALPHARAWLAHASGQLPGLPPLPPPRTQAPAVPATMHTGRGSTAAAAAGAGAAAPPPRAAATLAAPVAPRSWQGLVRVGLASLAAAEEQLAGAPAPLPETLALDEGRLHACKEAFQRLLVLAACLLLAQQGAAAAGRAAPAPGPLRARLAALLAGGEVSLHSLAAEVAAAGGAPAAGVAQALQRMLASGSAGFRALCGGLTKVLQLLLLSGGLPPEELAAQLARFGAAPLAGEALALAQQLRPIAAVTEAVHGATYQQLAAGLL